MTVTEFNEKYKNHIEEGHYGLAISNDKVIEGLDVIFVSLFKDLPKLKFSQIKMKFGRATVYLKCEGLTFETLRVLERGIEAGVDFWVKQ